MKVSGRCYCGQISFEAEIEPDKVRVCHCTDCQTLSGSAFRTNVPVVPSPGNFRPQNHGAVVKTLLATRSSEDDPRILQFCNGFCL